MEYSSSSDAEAEAVADRQHGARGADGTATSVSEGDTKKKLVSARYYLLQEVCDKRLASANSCAPDGKINKVFRPIGCCQIFDTGSGSAGSEKKIKSMALFTSKYGDYPW